MLPRIVDVGKSSKPDLFLTHTCSPKCPEITSYLGPSEIVQNRPDLVARVFKIYPNEILADIKARYILGIPIVRMSKESPSSLPYANNAE